MRPFSAPAAAAAVFEEEEEDIGPPDEYGDEDLSGMRDLPIQFPRREDFIRGGEWEALPAEIYRDIAGDFVQPSLFLHSTLRICSQHKKLASSKGLPCCLRRSEHVHPFILLNNAS